MEKSDKKEQRKNKLNDIKIFNVPFALGEIKENISITTKIASKPSKEDMINQSFKFHSEGNISEAAKLYQCFINQGFTDHRVFANYGIILKDLGKLKEAEIVTRKAININPNFSNAYSNLGTILMDLGKLKEAELSYRKAIKLKPDHPEAHFNLGNILRDLGKLKEAEISTRKALELKPSYPEIHFNLGTILKDLGKLKEAEISTRKAIKLDPNFANAYSNLGTILMDLGKLKEAELSYRKAIELKPNHPEAHSNLGNVLNFLGSPKEAEFYVCKAIKLDPNFANAYLNLGNILRDLGELKQAEVSTREAIKLNPDFANGYCNLGTILMDLGKLKEAEISTRKAIELQPDHPDAHFNLGNILRDLGKLKDLILLSESTLESKTINQGYKLLASLQSTIAHLLKNDFSGTLLNLNKTNDLMNKGALNTIKGEMNKKHLLTFSRFISLLYPLLYKENKHFDSEEIPHFGESHCLSFAHQTLSISSHIQKIQPVLITGGKAWHFSNKENNKWKDSLNQQIKNHTYGNTVFISFGEIDCRKNEGILNYAVKKHKDISKVCEKTINGYLDYMEEILSPYYKMKFYFGVPAPLRQSKLLDDLDIKRIEMIKLYNSLLKREVLSRGSFFLDVYALTTTKDGENNNLYMCDETHLSPKCLDILFKDHLYKT